MCVYSARGLLGVICWLACSSSWSAERKDLTLSGRRENTTAGYNKPERHVKSFLVSSHLYLSARWGCRSSGPGFAPAGLQMTQRHSPPPQSFPKAPSHPPASGLTPMRTCWCLIAALFILDNMRLLMMTGRNCRHLYGHNKRVWTFWCHNSVVLEKFDSTSWSSVPGTLPCGPPEPAPPSPPTERRPHGKWRAAGKLLPPAENTNMPVYRRCSWQRGELCGFCDHRA